MAFVPLPGGGYLLGHNRDESRSRAHGRPPAIHRFGGVRVLAPGDPDGGGTWLGVDTAGRTVCILNAAEPEGRSLPERPRSRGLVVRDVLARGLDAALSEPLADVRAFEILAAEPGADGAHATCTSVRWDGRSLSRERSAGLVVRVSSTLDPIGAGREREASWRRRFGDRAPASADELASWLASHEPERGTRSVCMHRNDAGTVSRSVVEVRPGWAVLEYTDGPPCETSSPRRTHGFPVHPAALRA